MPKNKTHKGLLKRVRITKTGKVRHAAAGFKHLRSKKSPDRLRRLRRGRVLRASDTKRLSKLIFRRLRGANQPRSAMRRNPNPAERAEMRAEARKALEARWAEHLAQASE